ncbi:urea ABC transporter substrate-binding protein [Planctomicrobium piriforme]|uniref:non-specific serine/threonine protein kinase n=1 Tax=Planctomicrobium piriforme TaxID=1576369 RepID=A0A1I3PWW0_9PLAN|nr:urea ABC transporter substrate-binding protein [Planctomicrobium piriforme]SFJ26138.1 urea transport system substrate-binding protein [Planctomicrobium piriforme]
MTGNASPSPHEPEASPKPHLGETQVVHNEPPAAIPGETPGVSGKETQSLQAAQTWVGKPLGKYKITGVLGKGGMGIVLKGHDSLIDRDVAIKLLPEDLSADATSLNRFLTEARAAGKLSHPNVVSIYEVGAEGAMYYLVMELIAGGSIEERLSKGKAYSPFEATRIMIDACQGIVAAHHVGLVHRDMKPANLLRAHDGRVKVTDFGIVKEVTAESQQVTRAGVVVGTPYYMSPEQCEGRPIDVRCDVYSLGATYFSLLTGRSPYVDSKSVVQVMYAHCHLPPPDPLEVDATIPPACAEVVRKAMAKSPEDRYQTAAEMLADLNMILAAMSGATLHPGATLHTGQLLATQPRGLPKQPILTTPPQSNRRQFLWAAGLGGLAVVGGGIGAIVWNSSRKGESAAAVVPPVAVPTSGEPIKVGVLHSLSGTMASSETSVVDATLLAIEEINQAGGLLGRKIKPVVVDGRSDWPTFAREAERLINQEKVCTIFGGWTSASRKTMKPVFEETGSLLVYPLQYEGLETSPNIVYMGAAPNQQILPAIDWVQSSLGKKKFFLVGSDYVFPRSAHAIIKDHLRKGGAEVVGEEFLPLGSQLTQGVIEKIKAAQPDMILNTINGDTNVAFFRDLRAAGITPSVIPTLSFSIGENELRSFDLNSMQGDYAAWTYFESIDTPANKEFVERFHERYPQRVITDPMESAYVGVKLWGQAVKEASSIEPKAIRRAMLDQRMAAPEGAVRIDAETQHCFKTPRLGQIRNDGQFDIVWTAKEPVRPEPYPVSRTAADWKAFLHDLYTGWGNQWAAK